METFLVRTSLRTKYVYSYSFMNRNILHHHSVRYWLARHKPAPPRRRWNKRMDEIEKLKNPIKLPIFDKVFNNFAKLAHPDQLQGFGEEYKSLNATSWAKFTEILKVINVKGSQRQMIPNQAIYRMDFYIRPSKQKIIDIKNKLNVDQLDVDIYSSKELKDEIKKIRLDLRLSGQRCPDLMKVQIENFFKQCGIKQYQFEWGPNYWSSSRDKLRLSQDEKQRQKDSEFVEKEEKVVMEKEKRSTLDKLKFWKRKK